MASEMGAPFLGRIPIDPKMVESGDSGKPFVESFAESETSKAFSRIIEPLLALA